MKIHCLPLAIALACAALPWGAVAQAGSPAPRSAASAPPDAKPGPKPLTPQQARDSATMPGDMRPEHPVVPQINVPLGKKEPVPPKPPPKAARGGDAASAAGGIDDAVARCEAEVDAKARADCHAKLARQRRNR
jgi:hypothetical protein